MRQTDEIYALVAWVLNQYPIIGDDAIWDAHSLPKNERPTGTGSSPIQGPMYTE